MSLREKIIVALERGKEPDPRKVAMRVMQKLTDEERAHLVREGLVTLVATAQREARANRSFTATPRDEEAPKPSRWDNVRLVAPFIGKFLDECGADDLREIIARYDDQVARLRDERAHYEALLIQLETSGAATVGDLGVERRAA